MPTAVAVEGDTQAETSTAKHSEDTDGSGSWSLAKLTVVPGTKISVQNKKVELSATASWTYAGGTTTKGTVTSSVGPFSDTASLMAGSTKLTDAKQGILIDGDEATGSLDSTNKITVSASQSIVKTD